MGAVRGDRRKLILNVRTKKSAMGWGPPPPEKTVIGRGKGW